MKVGAAAMQQKSAQISNNQDRIFQHKQQYSHCSGHPFSGHTTTYGAYCPASLNDETLQP
jgi:hypothetical protein